MNLMSLICTDSLFIIEDSIKIYYKLINYNRSTCFVTENGFVYFPEKPFYYQSAEDLLQPVLKIAGMAVGDSINKDNFIFTGTECAGLFDEIVVESAKSLRNTAISVQLLPNNIIYHIEKEINSALQFERLKEDISSILQFEPEVFVKDYDSFTGSNYTWEHNGFKYSIIVITQKQEMFLAPQTSYTFTMENDILQQIIVHYSQ